MKAHLWAVEEMLTGMMVLDAYLLLKSLGIEHDEILILGRAVKCTLQSLANTQPTRKIDDPKLRVYFTGGPHWRTDPRPFVLTMKCYVADRVLRSIIVLGNTKVSRIIEEII